ncbi:MAG: hypothetical protein JJT89_13590 [Nitriliruptoraceae bacterium]|nr:hypothetical protein [Nitriliruptoraceae bacterium]
MSQLDWPQLYPSDGAIDGPPVRELPSHTRASAQRAEATARIVEELTAMLRGLGRLDDVRFTGASASAMVATITDVGASLDGVGPVFHQLATHLGSHASILEQQRADARTALARANAAWGETRAAQSRQHTASEELTRRWSRREQLEAQVQHWTRQLDATSPEDAGAFVIRDRLRESEGELWQQRSRVQVAEGELADAQRATDRAEVALEYWRDGPGNRLSWHALREREERLNRGTAAAIDAIDLFGLADPGLLERTFQQIQDLTSWLVEGGREFLQAIYDGDFIAFVKSLEDVLGVLMRVLDVVIAVAFLAAIVFPPAAVVALATMAFAFKARKVLGTAKFALTTVRLKIAIAAGDDRAVMDAGVDLVASGTGKIASTVLISGTPMNTKAERLAQDVVGSAIDRTVAGSSGYLLGNGDPRDEPDRRPVTASGVRCLPAGETDRRLRCEEIEGTEPFEFGPVTPRLCEVGGGGGGGGR